MSRPAVSVVIPCYNLGAYVNEAVESVLNQTFDDAEILIVDDGSGDESTRGVLKQIDRPRTRVISIANAGVGAARNYGIGHTAGRYLCFLDADDLLALTYFEKSVPVLEAHPEIAFVSSWLRTFGEEEWIWKQDRCDFPTLLAECTVTTAALVRRDAVLSVGGYRTDMPTHGYEDWDLWISLVERGFKGTIIPEPLLLYRRRADSMSASCCHGEAHLALIQSLIDRHEASYREHLFELWLMLERTAGEVLGENYALEEQIARSLNQLVVHKRRELDRLRSRPRHVASMSGNADRDLAAEADRLRTHVHQLQQALERARHEVFALQRSKSWQLTAPFRALGRLLPWSRSVPRRPGS